MVTLISLSTIVLNSNRDQHENTWHPTFLNLHKHASQYTLIEKTDRNTLVTL